MPLGVVSGGSRFGETVARGSASHGRWSEDRIIGSFGDDETPGDEIVEGTLAWIEGDGENVGQVERTHQHPRQEGRFPAHPVGEAGCIDVVLRGMNRVRISVPNELPIPSTLRHTTPCQS